MLGEWGLERGGEAVLGGDGVGGGKTDSETGQDVTGLGGQGEVEGWETGTTADGSER